MAFGPEINDLLADASDEPKLPQDETGIEIATAGTEFLRRLMMMTGHGVVPGVPGKPTFVVVRPTMEERAERRRRRKEAGGAATTEQPSE